MNIRQPVVATLEMIGQTLVVQSQLIENRRLEIMDVDLVPDRVVTASVAAAVKSTD